MAININEEWRLHNDETGKVDLPTATILADDGARYPMFAPRARRIVALWNMFLGVPTESIERWARYEREIQAALAERKKNG